MTFTVLPNQLDTGVIPKEENTKRKKNNTNKRRRRGIEKPRRRRSDASGSMKKRRRFRPGTVALREIKKYQKGSELLSSKAPLERQIRSILADLGDYRLQDKAIEALRESIEYETVILFQDAKDMAEHAHRETIMVSDFRAAQKVKARNPGKPIISTRSDQYRFVRKLDSHQKSKKAKVNYVEGNHAAHSLADGFDTEFPICGAL